MPQAFSNIYRPFGTFHSIFKDGLYEDLDTILKNVILNAAFGTAKYYSAHSTLKYPIEMFKDSNGNLNETLRRVVVEMLSLSAEYNALLQNPRINKTTFLRAYALNRRTLAGNVHNKLYMPKIISDMNRQFIEKLRDELDPEKLFPMPKAGYST